MLLIAALAAPAEGAERHLSWPDLVVLALYLVTVIAVGFWFARRQSDSDEFMAASRSLPGWAVGLSMFGSYVSSISFLANPGTSYDRNWNSFVFSLATPIAAVAAVLWFVPFYRRLGNVSAYEHLEDQFGPWARTYAVVCFLLVQMARMGAIVYLLAITVEQLTGWPVVATIFVTGAIITLYTMAGGMAAVVWVGVLQSTVLIAGVAICVAALLWKIPGGFSEVVETGRAAGKFSLGSFGPGLSQPTFWVVFVYGLAINLANFSVDQSYVQRYITARSDRDAAKSVWITALFYVPVAAIFFFVGTALFVFYGERPELLGAVTKADKVFPHFIATQLPAGIAGLVVAALFASSMDANLNNMATLTLCDIYKRYFRPQAGERESLLVLRTSTVAWGIAGTAMGLWMIRVGNVLDEWWKLAGLFSGGVLGLFLLGLILRRPAPWAGLPAIVVGILVTVWLTLPALVDVPASIRNPMHSHMTIVVATLVMFFTGFVVAALRPGSRREK
jgi:SSS family solute:Na+ symporter